MRKKTIVQRKKSEFQTAASCSLQIGAVSALRRMSLVRRVPVVVMQSDPNRLATYAVAGIIWADHRAITAFTKDGMKECGAVCWPGGNVELVSMRIYENLVPSLQRGSACHSFTCLQFFVHFAAECCRCLSP